MDANKVRALAEQIIAELDTAAAPPPSKVIRVTAGQSLRSAINAAAPGSTLVLDNMSAYDGPFVIDKPLTITALTPPPPGRVSRGYQAPRLVSGGDTVTIRAGDAALVGLRVL